jgi:methionyl-tRNA synthetase
MSKFYITTSIAYVNAPPHIGFALELLQADVLARYHRLKGEDVWFLTGTDEHGMSVFRSADKANLSPQEFVDKISQIFRNLTKKLHISNDDFIRTSDKVRHWPSVIKFWEKLLESDNLYKKKYKGWYCVGHESFVKKSDLVDGKCPLHKTFPEEIEEENWFFKLTKYKKIIRNIIEKSELKIIPESRTKEVLNLLDDAEDISFSRPITSLKWGIPVPNDSEQIMYVWADALTNYISALGYNENHEKFNKFWPADIHLIGKDILRFHAIYWPAMLLAAGLPLPKSIYVHGFITVEGEKMSKTIGNVIDPFDLIEKYGSEATRYFLLREIASTEDGDFSYKKLEERYNGDLANGLGNLINRVAMLIQNNMNGLLIYSEKNLEMKINNNDNKYEKAIEDFRLHDAVSEIWKIITRANQYIDEQKPWIQVKENQKEFLKTMSSLVALIQNIAFLLKPFLPVTSEKIIEIFNAENKKNVSEGHHFVVKNKNLLFPRI